MMNLENHTFSAELLYCLSKYFFLCARNKGKYNLAIVRFLCLPVSPVKRTQNEKYA